MKFIFLRFCYAVEIGAYLAYVGHYSRTNDQEVKRIKREELEHMIHIKRILGKYGRKPFVGFNLAFLAVGHLIRIACKITPAILLDGIAQIMEVFNIISYDVLGRAFPEDRKTFELMEKQESEHEIYFSTFPKYGRSNA